MTVTDCRVPPSTGGNGTPMARDLDPAPGGCARLGVPVARLGSDSRQTFGTRLRPLTARQTIESVVSGSGLWRCVWRDACGLRPSVGGRMAKKERREGPPPTTRFVAPPPVLRPHKPGDKGSTLSADPGVEARVAVHGLDREQGRRDSDELP